MKSLYLRTFYKNWSMKLMNKGNLTMYTQNLTKRMSLTNSSSLVMLRILWISSNSDSRSSFYSSWLIVSRLENTESIRLLSKVSKSVIS